MAMWRQITAWIGGVGIIVLFLAVLPRLRIGGRQALFKAESAGPELGLSATIRESARRFVVLYVGITAAEVAILTLVRRRPASTQRMTFYNAVAHLVRDDRHRGLLARAALDRAVRRRVAVGDRRSS